MENDFDSPGLDGSHTELDDTELENGLDLGEDIQELDEIPGDDGEGDENPLEVEEKTYKMKIKGEERDITSSELKEFFKLKGDTDLTDEVANVLVNSRQIHIAGQQAFTEASNAMKQIESFVTQLQSNPMEVLTDPKLGIDFDKLAEDYIIQKITMEMMPEGERKSLLLQQENEKLKRDRDEHVSNQQRQQYEQETAAYTDHFANDIASAAQDAGLPVSEFVFSSASKYMRNAYQQSGEVPSAREVIPLVKRDLAELAQSLGKTLPPEQIAELFGEEALKKVREYEVKRVRSPKQANPGSYDWNKNKQNSSTKTSQGGKKMLNIEEFRQMMDERIPIRN